MDLATIDFAADPTGQAYGDWVIRRAPLLFKAGEYPDKQFSMTNEELRSAVNDFRKPAEFKIEHKDSILDGKLGLLVRAEYHEQEGQSQATMSGKCMIPRWLHDLFPDKPLPLSVSWDRKTKRVSHVGFVTSPRVAGAAAVPELEAAFANFAAKNESVNGGKSFDGYRTEHGMSALQQIHDISAHHGSLCKMPAEVEKTDAGENVASSKKVDAHGKPGDQKTYYMSTDDPEDFAALAQAMFMHGSERDALQIIHDASSKVGAKCNYQPVKPGENLKPLKTGTPAETTSTDSSGQKGYQFNSDDPAIKELQTQLAKQKEITENQRKKAVAAEAATFANDEIVVSHRSFPTEKQALIDLYTMAADADNAIGGTVDFSGGKTTRVAALLASHAARPPHPLAKESIPAGQNLEVLLSRRTQEDPSQAGMSDERRKELLTLTPLGQKAYEDKVAATNGKH